MSDSEIINRIKTGDKNAFGEVVKKHQGMIINTCYGFVMRKEDAEDIAQNVFIEAYKGIENFRENSKISTWLYRIAVNKSIDFLRKEKRVKRFGQFTNIFDGNQHSLKITESNNNPYEKIVSKERLSVLNAAINKLPKNQNIAFRLSKFDDLPGKEISEIMNLSLSSVESLLHRAKIKLREILYDYYKNEM